MSVVVRFPPSPTGFLHIGSARTALFNWLYAKRHGGTFLLRIEDTDRERSTPESVETILDGLRWLGMGWDNADDDGEGYYSQFAHRDRHVAVAQELLKAGKAYYCYTTPEELAVLRAEQKEKGLPQRYDGRWRDRPASEAPQGVPPCIRLKAPQEGETLVEDKVMGAITVPNAQLDDMVLVRADGTPTYMLAVVVDDHDMGVTHVIRGDDHMTNTFRQVQIYKALGWDVPSYAHIPMILGPDGAKLSKRHGAPGVASYRDQGYLPEAINNYLLRLCWSHGDDEIISQDQAIAWFDLDGVGKSPARFDFAKLKHLNAHYIMEKDPKDLAALACPFLEKELGRALSPEEKDLFAKAMPDLQTRAQLLTELASQALFYFKPLPLTFDDKAQKQLTDESRAALRVLTERLAALQDFSAEEIESVFRNYATEKELKLGKIAQPFRAALTGTTVSPPIFKAAALLGREKTLERLNAVIN